MLASRETAPRSQALRVALLTPGAEARSQTRPFVDAMRAAFDLRELAWTGGPWPAVGDTDVAVSFVKFRHLLQAETIDWDGFTGLKVHYDWDALQDAHWTDSPYAGTWAGTLRRHGFDLAITTGVRARDGLRAQGIDAEAIHKAAAGEIRDLGRSRDSVYGTFGYDYPSRVLMKAELRRADIPVEAFKVPFAELGDALNRFLAVISCTLDARLRAPAVGRHLHRLFPRTFVVTGSSPEPMGKFFEIAASGAAPFVDWTPDLDMLGFVDGRNCITYRTIPELVERARHLLDRPDELRAIGTEAASTARGHTWAARADTFRAVFEERLSAR